MRNNAHAILGGEYLSRQDSCTRSRDEINMALSLDPRSRQMLLDRARSLYTETREFGKALQCLSEIDDCFDVGDADPVASLGNLYFAMGRLDDAIAKYREALEIKPDFGTEYRIACMLCTERRLCGSIEMGE